MSMNSVSWFEIYVDDMPRAKKFYETVFNKSLDEMRTPDGSEMQAFNGSLEKYGATGALVKMEGFPAGKNSVLVYFGCEDCAIEEKKVIESGGKVEKSKFSIGEYGFISIVNDTEGNMFGLHSMK